MANKQLWRAHIHIKGRVQKVGFRWASQQKARHWRLTGWVRNHRNGQVEMVLAGSLANIQKMCAWLPQGPPLAKVTAVDVKLTPIKANPHLNFQRRPTL